MLDLTKHFIILIPRPYEVTLSWESKISQTSTEVCFNEMILFDNLLGLLKILKKYDKILIDCTDHTTECASRGHFKLTFTTMVYNSEGLPYNLSDK